MPRPNVRLEADLSFRSTSSDGRAGAAGTVTADGTTITIDVTAQGMGAGNFSKRQIRHLARSLAQRRLSVLVQSPSGLIIALGDVQTPWWQQLVTRSPHIRLGNLRDVRKMTTRVSARRDHGSAMVSLPPTTVLPLFPTVSRLGPRPVTTTHDPRGGGKPRLIFASSPWPHPEHMPRVEYLTKPRTTLGSAPNCDIVIEGLEPLQAVIERNDEDEYLLTHLADAGNSTIAGVHAQRSRLRTSARISLSGTTLIYFREEYADHGRPYGGRQGGEFSHQRPQATPRPRAKGAVGKPRTNRNPGRYYP